MYLRSSVADPAPDPVPFRPQDLGSGMGKKIKLRIRDEVKNIIL
jgi:hypothetical protein